MLSSTSPMLCGQARSSCRDTEFRVTSLARAREGDVTDRTNLCSVRRKRTVAGFVRLEVEGLAKKIERCGPGLSTGCWLGFMFASTQPNPGSCESQVGPSLRSDGAHGVSFHAAAAFEKEMPGAAETLGDSPPPAIPPADAPAPIGEMRLSSSQKIMRSPWEALTCA